MNFHLLTRNAIRASLSQNGPQTCSDLVRGMGLDLKRHERTMHAVMVDLEKQGILGATRSANGKRDEWFIMPEAIRKRDRIIAAMFG